MPFIGNQPALSYTSFAKQDFTTSATTSYTLDHPVTNANELALFINFVRQEPTTAYSASGTSLTLTSATSASDDMYCVFLGKAVQTVNPPNSSVGSSQVSADLITGQTALGATPADTDELLISDAGTLKRVDYSYLKSANTPSFRVGLSSAQTIANSTHTIIIFNSEQFDTDSAYDTSTGRFTVPSGKAGKYYFNAMFRFQSTSVLNVTIKFQKNGTDVIIRGLSDTGQYPTINASLLIDLAVGDYITVTAAQGSGADRDLTGSVDYTNFSGFKLIT